MRISLHSYAIAISPNCTQLGSVSAKKIFQVVLMVLCGGGCALAQIEAKQAVQIAIAGVPVAEKAKIDAVYPVSEEGMINLPFVGKIKAAGRTPEQLAADIENAYIDAGIYVTPKVTVIDKIIDVIEVAVIHIGGQVRKPGPLDYLEGTTLWDAIQAAGGVTEFGSMKRVNLYRDGEQKTYDLTKNENRAIPLFKNDTVEVPQKSFGCR
jgi:protein involved in polysaccharide export with SLBB domain